MGELKKTSLLKCLLLVFIVSCMVVLFSGDVFTAYNMNASHKVNQSLNMDEEKKYIWIALRKMGYSEEATAGIMGNWMQESGCNSTVTQNHVSWANFKKGTTGLGLAQWTYYSRQDGLFEMADSMGRQWTDKDVQLKYFEKEVKNYDFSSVGGLSGFKKSTDVNKATVIFENVYEQAGTPKMETRKKYANEIYRKYAGTKLTGSSSSSSSSSSNSSSSSSEDSESAEVVYESTDYGADTSGVDSMMVISEWDLTGMSRSGFLNDAYYVELPEYEYLSTGEKYSLSILKEDLSSREEYKAYDFIRTLVTFSGLCVIVYSVLMLVAYLFDRTNNLVEISLLRVITFGKIGYTDEKEFANMQGYANGSRIIKISIVSMVVGFIIISGMVFNWILDVIYWVNQI